MNRLELNLNWLGLFILASATAGACSSASSTDEFDSTEGAIKVGWGKLQICGIDQLIACPNDPTGNLSADTVKFLNSKGIDVGEKYTTIAFPGVTSSTVLYNVKQPPCTAKTDFGLHCEQQPATLSSDTYAINILTGYKNFQLIALDESLYPKNQANPEAELYGTIDLPKIELVIERKCSGTVTTHVSSNVSCQIISDIGFANKGWSTVTSSPDGTAPYNYECGNEEDKASQCAAASAIAAVAAKPACDTARTTLINSCVPGLTDKSAKATAPVCAETGHTC